MKRQQQKYYSYVEPETRDFIRRTYLAAVIIIGEKRYVRCWPSCADRKFWGKEAEEE